MLLEGVEISQSQRPRQGRVEVDCFHAMTDWFAASTFGVKRIHAFQRGRQVGGVLPGFDSGVDQFEQGIWQRLGCQPARSLSPRAGNC